MRVLEGYSNQNLQQVHEQNQDHLLQKLSL